MMDLLEAFGRAFFRLFQFAHEADDRPEAQKMLSGCITALVVVFLALALSALIGW
jgi:hypothetical protein